MKSFLIFGIGDFGMRLARELKSLNKEVCIVDFNEDKINLISEEFESAYCADGTQKNVLTELGVQNFDCCIVAVGEHFQTSLQITNNLKELGAKYIIAKSYNDFQSKFLKLAGADEAVYPEKEFAINYAIQLGCDNLFKYFKLTDDFKIAEIKVPVDWVNKTVVELNIRQKYDANIIAVLRNDKIESVKSNTVFEKTDKLYVAGTPQAIDKLTK